MLQGNAREAKRVIGDVEWEEGHEPHEGNEAPALCLDPGDQSIELAACLSPDPIRCDVARNEECDRRAQCRAAEIEHRAPKWPKKCAAQDAENRAGNEENRPQGKKHDVARWRPQAEIVHRALDQSGIETI